MNGSRVEAITKLIMDSLMGDSDNLMWKEVASKLVSFGANGTPLFHGQWTGVIALS